LSRLSSCIQDTMKEGYYPIVRWSNSNSIVSNEPSNESPIEKHVAFDIVDKKRSCHSGWNAM
jgi:hypothetical protein